MHDTLKPPCPLLPLTLYPPPTRTRTRTHTHTHKHTHTHQWKSESEKKALKNSLICFRSNVSSMSMPNVLNARCLMRGSGQVARHTAADMDSASASVRGPRSPSVSSKNTWQNKKRKSL